MSDTTLSPAPFSPFSSYSVTTSGATSDGQLSHLGAAARVDPLRADAPDLGAFATVFRELNNTYQHPRGNGNGHHLTDSGESARTPTSTFLFSDYDSEAPVGSTVWAQGPIADYLDQTDSEDADQGDVEDGAQPSLGLAGVFDFLAEERARLAAMREANTAAGRIAGHSSSTTSDGTWRHVVPARRRRRKRRADRSQSLHDQVRHSTSLDPTEEAAENDEDGDEDGEGDTSTSDSAPANYYESTPASPGPSSRHRRDRSNASTADGRPVIHHTRSTPSLRLPATVPIDPRVLQLRNLAHKLRMLYPKDARFLSAILSDDQPDDLDFIDPRGPVPRPKDTPVHVFIDQYVASLRCSVSALTVAAARISLLASLCTSSGTCTASTITTNASTCRTPRLR